MSDSESLALQGAIVSRLKAWPDLQTLVGGKIYDVVPSDTTAPYVEIGDFDDHRDDKTCVSGRTIYVTLHIWTKAPAGSSRAEASRIARAVEGALTEASLTMPSYRLISIDHNRTQVFKDLDDAHLHGVVEFTARTERLS
ncbi:DUF3168 domain-containing protein [Ochrobactrum soli]|uniref:Gene Transfer Agent (GTA) ORFG08 n=1 Tax=Ochrobactrum soli TaxID=2448455 RepID=A0A2P9HHY0_9HYPH|nr:DUF3168 domain-containing protein [[Ochrobactrum] soli]SPL63712.1 Gene Transfer Agent (GTA) ORFG08 [[Ochrobactrum] soli]